METLRCSSGSRRRRTGKTQFARVKTKNIFKYLQQTVSLQRTVRPLPCTGRSWLHTVQIPNWFICHRYHTHRLLPERGDAESLLVRHTQARVSLSSPWVDMFITGVDWIQNWVTELRDFTHVWCIFLCLWYTRSESTSTGECVQSWSRWRRPMSNVVQSLLRLLHPEQES